MSSPVPSLESESSLHEWLSTRSDAYLVELLTRRADLIVPPPTSLAVLAARAEQRPSVQRAADELNTVALTVIEVLLAAGAPAEPVRREHVLQVLKGRAPDKLLAAAVDELRALAIVWGDRVLRLVPAAAGVLPWPQGRSLDVGEPRSAAAIEAALATVSEPERALLEKLSTSSPVGRTRDAAPGTPADRPVQRLLTLGLLDWVDEQTVELPVQVGQVLRGDPVTDPAVLTQPPLPATKYKAADVNGVAAGEALELLRHCAAVLDVLGEGPAPALRAGGMGVRELRRIGKVTALDEARVSLLVEVLAAAGLIASGRLETSDLLDEFWAPTVAADAWLEAPPERRWAALAATWLDLPRRPWLVGMRDANDKPISALSDEVRSATAARDRALVLAVLAELPSGQATDAAAIARVLAWRRPRWTARFAESTVARTLHEAAALGVLGRGALSSPGRALLHGGDAEAEMAAALPEPVDYVLVQADLTVIAPGPLTAELQHQLVRVADVESAGAGAVFRISETSVRRGLDTGMTASELHALFATHSKTEVPQSLTYLIDDVARRHGQLRAGVAESFVRCEDPALLAQVLASPLAEGLALRALAPTVAISQAPLAEVLTQLRAAGFAPAGEDSSGSIIDLSAHGVRLSNRRPRGQLRMPGPPTPQQIEHAVREMRAGDRAAQANSSGAVRADGTRATGAATVALLQLAVRAKRGVSIGYVDAQGTASQRIVEPLAVGGGQLDAFDPATGSVRKFTLHRISSVALVD